VFYTTEAMQAILNELQPALAGRSAVVFGGGLLALLFAQGAIYLASGLRAAWYDRGERKLARRRLELAIKAAKLQCEEIEQRKLSWNGYRKFVVCKKVKECEDVYSFYLKPHDGKPLPPFKPGQYLTFQLNVPGMAKPLVRCYSISDSHKADVYRVTIKRATPPPDVPGAPVGIASSHFCHRVNEGDILDAKAPTGGFFLDTTHNRPVVLISGGVGITPMLCMLNAIVESGAQREVWFFFGARNRVEHIQKEYLEKVARERDNLRLHVCYSRPGPEDVQGKDYHHAERVSVEVFKRVLPSNNYEFFICGPGSMMKSVTDGLKEWGVPDKNIFFEAFGPATVKKAASPAPVNTTAAPIKITFSKSGKVVQWNSEGGSLLEIAEANGVQIEAGCRAGNCGTCSIAVKAGSVEFLADHHGAQMEEGSCLSCICRPKSDLVLDA
jgi:ferredoxin-NADP reductase